MGSKGGSDIDPRPSRWESPPRAGAFVALLSREEDIEVVAEAEGNGEVLARAQTCRPDVVVIDVDSEEGRSSPRAVS
jgi:DNA-binding NarL/FixJ family response regulator